MNKPLIFMISFVTWTLSFWLVDDEGEFLHPLLVHEQALDLHDILCDLDALLRLRRCVDQGLCVDNQRATRHKAGRVLLSLHLHSRTPGTPRARGAGSGGDERRGPSDHAEEAQAQSHDGSPALTAHARHIRTGSLQKAKAANSQLWRL